MPWSLLEVKNYYPTFTNRKLKHGEVRGQQNPWVSLWQSSEVRPDLTSKLCAPSAGHTSCTAARRGIRNGQHSKGSTGSLGVESQKNRARRSSFLYGCAAMLQLQNDRIHSNCFSGVLNSVWEGMVTTKKALVEEDPSDSKLCLLYKHFYK